MLNEIAFWTGAYLATGLGLSAFLEATDSHRRKPTREDVQGFLLLIVFWLPVIMFVLLLIVVLLIFAIDQRANQS